MATLSPFCIPYFFRVLARRQVRSRSSLRHRSNVVMWPHNLFYTGEQNKDELEPSEASRSPLDLAISAVWAHQLLHLREEWPGVWWEPDCTGERRKGGREPHLLQEDERARAASAAQSCQALAWVEQPASQWLSCCLQKSVSILDVLDAFFTYKTQSQATGNTCGINTRWNGSIVQRLPALFMLGNCWKCFTTSSFSLNCKGKQHICMHKEEKEKSWDTCVSGRFYKTFIKAGSPTVRIPLLSLHPAVPQSAAPSKTTATLA